MKYNPDLINKYPGIFKDRKTLGKYLALVKFVPFVNWRECYYLCTICKKHYKTEDGAYNHLDVKHEKEILNTINKK